MTDQTDKPRQSRPAEDSGPLLPILGTPESPDVQEIHAKLLQRERQEPIEGLEPTPWWVWSISVLVVFAMGFYLGRYGGTFTTDPDALNRNPAGVVAAAEPPPQGDLIYAGVCVPCHQAGGTGLAGKYPPLAGSEWVALDAGIPVRILLHGLQGPIQVKGETYVNQMPAWGPQLSDAEIAAVLSYVRSSFGNKAGPVATELVQEIRRSEAGAVPLTAEKLKALLEVKK